MNQNDQHPKLCLKYIKKNNITSKKMKFNLNTKKLKNITSRKDFVEMITIKHDNNPKQRHHPKICIIGFCNNNFVHNTK